LESSVESLVEALSEYGAQQIRLESDAGIVSGKAEGGALQSGFDALGSGPLVGFLVAKPELNAIELEDAGLTLRVARDGAQAQLQVRWASGEQYEETLPMVADLTLLHDGTRPLFFADSASEITNAKAAIQDPTQAIYVVETPQGQRYFGAGQFAAKTGSGQPLLGQLAASDPLGPAWFRERLGTRANYIAGAMAGGIGSPALVIAMGQGGYIGFYGSGGLPLAAVEAGIQEIKQALGDTIPAGFNLLHNPVEPQVEESTVDLFLKYGCKMVSASAFMGLTPAVVRYRYTGIHTSDSGKVACPNQLYAKVSRPEVAKHFLGPASEKMLQELVAKGGLTAQEAALAKSFPMADGITCEADSGGHTDGRPLSVILPVIKALRDRVAASNPEVRVAIGAAGGLGCPASIAAAFEMGADYVLTGSVNQCSPEAGTSDLAKSMLLQAGLADVANGAAPDMFEMGAHVQVLSRGSMYAKRSERLYDLYKRYTSWEEVPEKDRARVEKQMLCCPFEQVWADTESYWADRDPKQVERARTDGRHKMALVFRWYLGMSSRWARMGEASRKKDFQIWCGAAMGAFNDWVAGSTMEPLAARGVVEMADALLRGASVVHRARRLASQGVAVPSGAGSWQPV
jgi:trans-AT polyketide synthase/acyltransferase/oxidoreductase domain-containing protein